MECLQFCCCIKSFLFHSFIASFPLSAFGGQPDCWYIERVELKDKFGRIHDYLRISLIDKCNLRCTYCMPENIRFLPAKHLMSKDEILQLASIFVRDFGINKIRLTGGEPLLRKDAAEIFRGLHQLDVKLAITTNALLLHEFFDLFEEIGLRSLNISLDSLNAQKFAEMTRRDQFDRVMANIQAALKRGFRIKLNAVVIEGQNHKEVADFVSLTKEDNIHVRFIEFMPFSGNGWKHNKVYALEEILADVAHLGKLNKLEDGIHSTSRAYQIEGWRGSFAIISTVSRPFCEGCNRIRLTAEGKLRNCLFARNESDLLTPLREGKNVKDLIISEILAKNERLGGLPDFQNEVDLKQNLSGRAMVKIGG